MCVLRAPDRGESGCGGAHIPQQYSLSVSAFPPAMRNAECPWGAPPPATASAMFRPVHYSASTCREPLKVTDQIGHHTTLQK